MNEGDKRRWAKIGPGFWGNDGSVFFFFFDGSMKTKVDGPVKSPSPRPMYDAFPR